MSNKPMWKLFDSDELGPAESKNHTQYRGRPSFTSVSFLADDDKKINAI